LYRTEKELNLSKNKIEELTKTNYQLKDESALNHKVQIQNMKDAKKEISQLKIENGILK